MFVSSWLHLQQQRLRHRAQHRQLVRQRGIEHGVAVLLKRKDPPLLAREHRIPPAKRRGRVVAARRRVSDDPSNQPAVRGAHPVVAIDVQLRDQLDAGEIEQYAVEKRYVRKDGRTVWANVNARLVRDTQGRPLYYLALVEDISARKEAEAALRASEERYHRLFESSLDAIVITDEDDIFLDANEAAADLFGIPRDQLSRIFDPFYTTKAVGRGTGLGLSVSYGIIKEHAGTIDVRSTPGKGTSFRLEFPVARKLVNA